jgi:hypothetical protein
MKQPPPLDETTAEPRSLVSSRNAIRFLYQQSRRAKKPHITRIIKEALTCCDDLIAEGQENSYNSEDPFFYLYFLRAILELQPDQIRHLVALLQWLEIVPPNVSLSARPEKPK